MERAARRLDRRAMLAGVGAAVGSICAARLARAAEPAALDTLRDAAAPTLRRSPTITGRGRAGDRAVRLGPPAPTEAWTDIEIGRSTQGRPILVQRSRAMNERVHVMMIGGIHGDERDSATLVESCRSVRRPDDVSLTLLPVLNADGWAAETRNNANDVDLNRNFPWRWGADDHGPFEASELETRALIFHLEATRPDLVLFVHQPLGYVAPIGETSQRYAELWRDITGLRIWRDVLQRGGGETWTSQVLGLGALLVELSGWESTPEELAANRAAFQMLLDVVTPATTTAE
ncbi:MAG: M14 family zinc carboxypeptidase [Actinomycetota bacterium]